jgi:hypothetical protein
MCCADSFFVCLCVGCDVSSQPLDEGTKRVLELLRSKEFIRTILPVFSAKDLAAHGLFMPCPALPCAALLCAAAGR